MRLNEQFKSHVSSSDIFTLLTINYNSRKEKKEPFCSRFGNIPGKEDLLEELIQSLESNSGDISLLDDKIFQELENDDDDWSEWK